MLPRDALDAFPLLEIPGDPRALVRHAVPRIEYRAAPVEQRDALFTVVLEPEATVGQLNALLRAHDAHVASWYLSALALQVAAPLDPGPDALNAVAERMKGMPGVQKAWLDTLFDKPSSRPSGPAACQADGVTVHELSSVCVYQQRGDTVMVVGTPAACETSPLQRVHGELSIGSDGEVIGRVCTLPDEPDIESGPCANASTFIQVPRAQLPHVLRLAGATLEVPEPLPLQGVCVTRPATGE